jgi:hypothetical protein
MTLIAAAQKPVDAEQEEVKQEDVVDAGEASQQDRMSKGPV